MTCSRVRIRVCSAILTATTIVLLGVAIALGTYRESQRFDPHQPMLILNGVEAFTAFVFVLNVLICPFLDNAHRPTCFYALVLMDMIGFGISVGMSVSSLCTFASQGLICSGGAFQLAAAAVLFVGLLRLQRHKLDFEDRNTRAHFALRIAEMCLFIVGSVLGCIGTTPEHGKYDPKQIMFYIGFATLPVTVVTTYFAKRFPQSRTELRLRSYILVADILVLAELITIAVVLSLKAGAESLNVIGGYVFIMAAGTQLAIITILIAEMYYCALEIQPRSGKRKQKERKASFEIVDFERA